MSLSLASPADGRLAARAPEKIARAWSSTTHLKTLPLGHRLWRHAASPTLRTRELFGHRIVLDVARSSAQQQLFLEGEWFVAESSLVQSLVVPNKGVIDVGANIGYYLLLFAQAGAEPIVGIEPDLDNLTEVRRTIAANTMPQVEIVEAAVGASPGIAHFNPGLNGSVSDQGERQVRMVTVDEITPGDVGLIKIDVEGFERHVLEGAARTIETRRPRLFVEIHPALIGPGDLEAIRGIVDSNYEDVAYHRPLRDLNPLRRLVGPRIERLDEPPGGGAGKSPFWLVAQ